MTEQKKPKKVITPESLRAARTLPRPHVDERAVAPAKEVSVRKKKPRHTTPTRRRKTKDSRVLRVEAYNRISAICGTRSTTVRAVLEAAEQVIVDVLQEQEGSCEITVGTLLRVTRKIKPPIPEREGLHPLFKKKVIFKAKPRRVQLKVMVSKRIRDSASDSTAEEEGN